MKYSVGCANIWSVLQFTLRKHCRQFYREMVQIVWKQQQQQEQQEKTGVANVQ
jgi:hypothetical protein